MLVVHPSGRGRGVATKLIEAILEFCDSKGLDIWVDASAMAVKIYQKHQFIMVDEFDIVPSKDEPGPKWKDMQTMFPLAEHRMGLFRFAGGTRQPGQAFPWEVSSE